MNCATTFSKTHDVKTFKKFDFTITYGIVTEFHPKYVRVYKDKDGMRLTQEELQKMTDPSAQGLVADWEKTDEILESQYVEFARRRDPDIEAEGIDFPVEVWTTSDGIILGTVLPNSELQPGYVRMYDPCVVIYDGKSRINLVPIFNVARILQIREDAIKSIMPPASILLALYPGFILQNRQCVYQLKPQVALEVSPVLDNIAAAYEKH